jgi:hypothetical protein
VRALVLTALALAALATAGGAGSVPVAPDTRSCAQQSSAFNVQLLGHRQVTDWVAFSPSTLAGAPQRRAIGVVWSLGGPVSTSGIAVYGWTTHAASRFGGACTAGTPQRGGKAAKLRAPVRVRDGWHVQHRYACVLPGRFTVAMTPISGGRRLTVQLQRTGEVLAVVELRRGGGTLRASTRCHER